MYVKRVPCRNTFVDINREKLLWVKLITPVLRNESHTGLWNLISQVTTWLVLRLCRRNWSIPFCGVLSSLVGEGNGTPLQYSCLENPMDGGGWWAAVHGVAESRTWLSDFTFTFHFHALEKEMATHSCVLAWRILGMGEPGGLPSMGSHRVRHDWSNLAAAASSFLVGGLTGLSSPEDTMVFPGSYGRRMILCLHPAIDVISPQIQGTLEYMGFKCRGCHRCRFWESGCLPSSINLLQHLHCIPQSKQPRDGVAAGFPDMCHFHCIFSRA